MLIDDVTVHFQAGKGGNGAVAFQKVRLAQGPTGADGGRGASIYLEGVSDVGALQFYAGKKIIKAEDGKNGRGQFVDGRRGEDLVLKVPTGTTITNLQTGYAREITHVGEQLLILGGGNGGRGNFKFRSSTNTSPEEYEEGSPGDTAEFKLELRLIADVGLVGLPNAGKSTLLNQLTSAKSKVAHYAFTTLEPNLGAYYELIIADIPGLIEGASEGKGLGVKFLKHIERTKTLFHLVSGESGDPIRDYEIVRKELGAFNRELAEKQEYIFLTKSDSLTPEQLKKTIAAFKKIKKAVVPISILDDKSIEEVRKILNTIKAEKSQKN